MADWKGQGVRVSTQWGTLVGERWPCDKREELETESLTPIKPLRAKSKAWRKVSGGKIAYVSYRNTAHRESAHASDGAEQHRSVH